MLALLNPPMPGHLCSVSIFGCRLGQVIPQISVSEQHPVNRGPVPCVQYYSDTHA